MKIRSGFVSNSSSSSFIVAAGKNPAKVSITLEVDLEKYVQRTLNTEEEVLDYLVMEHGEERKSRILDCLQAIREGNRILVGDFSSEGEEPIEQLLCEIGIPKNTPGIKIIYNEGGY